jgi:hypothetical protein
MDVAKDILAFAVLFVVSAGLVGVGLEIWCRNSKRWRLIRNAYIEGVRDANKVNTAKENSND